MSLDPSTNQPKILVVGRYNRDRSKLLEAQLGSKTRRFGVVSAGVEPVEDLDPDLTRALEKQGIDPPDPRTHSLGQLIDEPLILIVFVSPSVYHDSPVIAAPCEELVLDLPGPTKADGEAIAYYTRLIEQVREDVLDAIVEKLPVDELE